MSPLSHAFAHFLAAARSGDDAAWRELYLTHSPAVLGYLRAQRAPAPEDLLAETWLQAVRDIDRFDGDEPGFRAWLLRVAHHRLLDLRRAAQRRVVEVEATPSNSEAPRAAASSEPGARLESEQQLLDLLDGIPERQRSALYLRFVLDLSQREVAQVLGISTPALKMLQARAVRALERRVRERADDAGAEVALPSRVAGRLEE